MRKVPIVGYLKELLLEMDIFSYPDDYYVFGTNMQNRSKHSPLQPFTPNPFMIERKYCTDYWHKEVHLKLKIKANMYAEKHKSIDDKLIDGISLDHIQALAGHTTKQMTIRYQSKLLDVAKKAIEEKSRKF